MSANHPERPFHPIANEFPLMGDAQLKELAGDIAENGQKQVCYLLDGLVLDGRNRWVACTEILGQEPACTPYLGPTDEDSLRSFVDSMNEFRRHLTPEFLRTRKQKREAVAASLKADPQKSNRQIADVAGVDHKTVADVRDKLERRGEIPHVEERTDTRGRSQPASKPETSTPEEMAEDLLQQGVGVREVSRETGIPKSTVQRLKGRADDAKSGQNGTESGTLSNGAGAKNGRVELFDRTGRVLPDQCRDACADPGRGCTGDWLLLGCDLRRRQDRHHGRAEIAREGRPRRDDAGEVGGIRGVLSGTFDLIPSFRLVHSLVHISMLRTEVLTCLRLAISPL